MLNTANKLDSKPSRNNRKVFPKFHLIMVILTLSLFTSCSRSCGGIFGGGSGVGVPVTVQNVEIKQSSPNIEAAGMLIPSDRADITLPAKAKIDKVFVQAGKFVNQGEPLFKISEEEILSQLNILRSTKREAEAVLEKNNFLLKNREKLVEEGKTDQAATGVGAGGLDKDVVASEANVDRVRSDIASMEGALEKTIFLSPVKGVVIKESVYDGAYIQQGQIILSIVNTDPILVSFPLTADESTGIQIGMPIEVGIDELGGEKFTAEVTYISPELHQAGKTFDVWAAISNPDKILKAGMRATAKFKSLAQHKMLVIPSSALIQRGSETHVFIVKDGLAKEVKVTPKQITKELATILNGLDENDVVVVKGVDGLQDGTAVDIFK